MARQVQVLISCDWCNKIWRLDDEEAPEEREWSWNGVAYVVELCDGCKQKVREHLTKLFEVSEQKKRGPGRPKMTPLQKATKVRRKLPRGSYNKYKNEDGKFVCPTCTRPFDYPQHLGNHHFSIHGSYLD